MKTLDVTHDTSAGCDQVWAVMTDLERSPEVISAIDAVQRLDPGTQFGVGTRWRETRNMFGRSATEEMAVTALTPGRSYTVEATSGGVHYVSELSVTPTDDGSRLRMTFSAAPTTTTARILSGTVGRLFRSATRTALGKDLADIAAAAEARMTP